MLETPDLSYVGAEESKRQFCVATVRRDARTGTVSVTAAGDDRLLVVKILSLQHTHANPT